MKKLIKRLIILFFIIYIVFPIVTNVILSFSNVWKWPNILPNTFSLEHYEKAIKSSNVIVAIKNTVYIGVLVMIGNFVLAMPSAYTLSRMESKYKIFIVGFILIPIIVPPLLILMNLYISFIKIGLSDTLIGVVISHMIPSLPYMFLILYLGFEKIDKEYEKLYLSLGATPLKGFISVILPQLKASIILGGVLSFLISISQYLSTLFIGGGRIITLNLLLTPYINGGNARVGAAYSTLLIIFCFIFIIIYEKILLGGKNAKCQ